MNLTLFYKIFVKYNSIFIVCFALSGCAMTEFLDDVFKKDQKKQNVATVIAENEVVDLTESKDDGYANTKANAGFAETDYVVKKGDTLIKIANMLNVSVGELMNANNLANSNKIYVGQVLSVPSSYKKSNKLINDGHIKNVKIEIYTVKKGDTLFGIARQYGVTVEQIRNINNFDTDIIYENQQIKIPVFDKKMQELDTDSVMESIAENNTYTVQAGDSLWSISRRCGVKVYDLARINNIDSPNMLQIGQILKLKEESVIANKSASVQQISKSRKENLPNNVIDSGKKNTVEQKSEVDNNKANDDCDIDALFE